MSDKPEKSKQSKLEKNMKKLPDSNMIRQRYKANRPAVQRAIQVMKQRGFFTDDLENCTNHRQVLFIYHYVIGLLEGNKNAAKAARDAGYRMPKKAGYRLLQRGHIARSVKTLLTRNDFLKNEIIADMNEMRKVDLTDFEGLIDGTKSLSQLKAEGVDTSMIDSLQEGSDRNGNRYVKIKLPKKLEVQNSMLKALENIEKNEKEDLEVTQNNTFVVVSSVPSHKSRSRKFMQIDAEGNEIKNYDENGEEIKTKNFMDEEIDLEAIEGEFDVKDEKEEDEGDYIDVDYRED